VSWTGSFTGAGTEAALVTSASSTAAVHDSMYICPLLACRLPRSGRGHVPELIIGECDSAAWGYARTGELGIPYQPVRLQSSLDGSWSPNALGVLCKQISSSESRELRYIKISDH
jgi:hypothetical protein